MQTKERKQLLKAVLEGDKVTIERLTKGNNLWISDGTSYYKNNLETPVPKPQFDQEFRKGFDHLIVCGDNTELQTKLMKEFGCSDEEIKAQLSKNGSFEETANNIIQLKERFDYE